MDRILQDLPQWWEAATSAGLVVLMILLGLLAQRIVVRVGNRWARRTAFLQDEILLRYAKRPLRLLLPLLFVQVVIPSLQFPEAALAVFRHLLNLTFIAALAWAIANGIGAVRDVILRQYDVTAVDNLKARAVTTQLKVIHRVAVAIVIVVAVATMLMTFERIRQVGVSILASAGIIGVIAGFAAQKSIATLFAGIQIAITQPIRLDDVVIVEGEWGRIEEITLTYVVVRIWDLRRLIVPITYFMEKPFQNWTRISANLLGTVYLYADYTLPVDEVRTELERLLRESEYWDGEAWGLQVTNATERTLELRALMSAADSGSAWNLRCQIREKLLHYLQERFPESLPRIRAEPEIGSAEAA